MYNGRNSIGQMTWFKRNDLVRRVKSDSGKRESVME